MSVVFLRKNTAQPLTHHLSRTVDSDNTPTCTLYSESGSELQSTTNCTKGPSTTLDSAAVAGQTTIPLAATTSIRVGEEYTITNAEGQSESVVCNSISSGVSVDVRHDLVYSYASTDTFVSHKVTVDVLAASITSAMKNCRAKWLYESEDQEHVEESVFHVSAYAPVCTVTEADVLRRVPDARNQIHPAQPLSDLIEEIWANEVLGDLAVVWEPSATISGDSLRVACIHRIEAHFAIQNEKFDAYDKLMERYEADIERAIATMPKDTDDDGASDDELTYHPRSLRIARC